ncbi:MAG: hypothetical protein HOV67_15930, partial [Kribbellaceae bacterium]|nr:hypothetical protein [Kribbellaceae bacterium]
EPGLLDELSDDAQADFAVPLGMSTSVLEDAEHTTLDLVAAACTVRYCGEPHLGEFPAELAELVRRLPK